MSVYTADISQSPLRHINTSFDAYLEKCRGEFGKHMNGSVPDYAFSLDLELRGKLDRIPHFYAMCKKINATVETRYMQEHNQRALQVGPGQYPEIYEMSVDCAHRLGIAVPNLYIVNSSEMNAYTYASDDTSPMVVLYTPMLDRLTPGELKCVIAHECGHVHNQHTVYKNVVARILNSGKGLLGLSLSMANIALMQMWTRAAEITADRAAIICCDQVEDAVNVNYKLLSGGTINKTYNTDIDLKALRAQLDMTINNPTKWMEVLNDHPSTIRRIFADKEFEECEVFYSWRPEMKRPESIMRSKAETDERCKKLVNILDNK